jgi:putative ABC transport system permease protein
MLVTVAERTTEIGIRLVVGACPGDIRNQFLLEASLLCTIGGLLGLAFGYATARVFADALGWTIEFSPMLATVAVGCAALIGLVFGLIPAERAARLDPVVALRSGQ